MRKLRGTLLTLLAQQSGQVQLLIIAPILTLSFLSLVVRTASSAVDSSVEKKKVTEQLKRRLNEVKNERAVKIEATKALVRPSQSATTVAPSKLPPVQQLLPPLQAKIKVGKKTSLASLLSGEGLDKTESSLWLAAAKKRKELQKLGMGRTVTLSFALSKKNDQERELRTISYELDRSSLFVLEKKSENKIIARKENLPITLVWKAVGGRINGALYKAALKAGVPKQLVDDLADMDWDIELSSDLRPGDTLKVIFEEYQRDGISIDHGRILAAEIVNRGRAYTLFSFAEPKSIPVPTATSRLFLRYPLQFTRITSVFTDARLHPILERVRPHTGVDFSAPRGTPVRSVANGKVTFAGRQAGYGNIVRIDHPGPYDTAYAHLDRIAKEVIEGTVVEKGQVIGFVGSTGLATGPHLHFELYKDGAFVNPLTAKIPMEDNLPRKENPVFTLLRKRASEQLSAMKIGDQPVSLAMAAPQSGKSPSREMADRDRDERLALATSSGSPSLIPGLTSKQEKSNRKKPTVSKQSSRSRGGKSRVSASATRSTASRSGKVEKSRGTKSESSGRTTKSRSVRTARR
jgi:murein DD-endopeptidase MepM/ murein hydrolase activator NlpD